MLAFDRQRRHLRLPSTGIRSGTFIYAGFLFPNNEHDEDVPEKLFIRLGNLFCIRDSEDDAETGKREVNQLFYVSVMFFIVWTLTGSRSLHITVPVCIHLYSLTHQCHRLLAAAVMTLNVFIAALLVGKRSFRKFNAN